MESFLRHYEGSFDVRYLMRCRSEREESGILGESAETKVRTSAFELSEPNRYRALGNDSLISNDLLKAISSVVEDPNKIKNVRERPQLYL